MRFPFMELQNCSSELNEIDLSVHVLYMLFKNELNIGLKVLGTHSYDQYVTFFPLQLLLQLLDSTPQPHAEVVNPTEKLVSMEEEATDFSSCCQVWGATKTP